MSSGLVHAVLMADNNGLTVGSLAPLNELSDLQVLSITNNPINDSLQLPAILNLIRELKRLQQLHLPLPCVKEIKQENGSVVRFASCREAKMLVGCCASSTAARLCKSLHYEGCSNLTEEGMCEVLEALSRLEHLGRLAFVAGKKKSVRFAETIGNSLPKIK